MKPIHFSGDYIDRCGELRSQPQQLSTLLLEADTRFVPVWQNQCLVQNDRAAMLRYDSIKSYLTESARVIFLGRLDNAAIFALDIDDAQIGDPDFGPGDSFVGLLDLSTRLPAGEAALVAYAKAMVAWQHRHRYCGVCGKPNQAGDGGFVMQCCDHACGHRSFPRLDPAIIVLAKDNERCLLGRQASWPEDRFSTIAGFVEPGESFEDALRREVKEETNIEIASSEYLGSQPWPFPAALMVGFHATATSHDIICNDHELAEAKWVTREDIASGDVILPPRVSIAYFLVATWFDQYDGPTLASLSLPAPPFRAPRPLDKS